MELSDYPLAKLFKIIYNIFTKDVRDIFLSSPTPIVIYRPDRLRASSKAQFNRTPRRLAKFRE
jgi:hypothetical protein